MDSACRTFHWRLIDEPDIYCAAKLVIDQHAEESAFLGILVHIHSESAGASLLYAGGAVIGGLVVVQTMEYLLIARPRIREDGGGARLRFSEVKGQAPYERLASRDFACLLPALAFTGALSWFLWASALGVNLFWVAPVVIVMRKPIASQS